MEIGHHDFCSRNYCGMNTIEKTGDFFFNARCALRPRRDCWRVEGSSPERRLSDRLL
jgi:hypothetical protein